MARYGSRLDMDRWNWTNTATVKREKLKGDLGGQTLVFVDVLFLDVLGWDKQL